MAAVALLALAACGGGTPSLSNQSTDLVTLVPPAPVPQVNTVDLPDTHDLSDWLADNPAGTVTVPAGEHRDAGGVRFSCPASGAACELTVTDEGGTVMVTSTNGMATASLVPTAPPPAQQQPQPPIAQQPPPTAQRSPQTFPCREGKCDLSARLHGLNGLGIEDSNAIVFSIQEGESRTRGRVRFLCHGPDPDCEVQILRIGYRYVVTYRGDVTARLHEEPRKIWAGIQRAWGRDGDNSNADDALCDLREGENCHSSRSPGSVKDGDLLFRRVLQSGPSQLYIMVEDEDATVPASYGFTGRRYLWSPESHGTDGNRHFTVQDMSKSTRLEAVLYTNADPATDKSYLSYGRWLYIDADGNWIVDAVMPEPLHPSIGGPSRGLGTGAVTATYSGGATGFYTLKDGAEEGHFTARATLNADFRNDSNLRISGAIDQFVDEDGRSRNWQVDLQSSRIDDRRGGEIRTRQKTVWTIDGSAADPARDWRAQVWDNGKSIQGVFNATHGTNARMVGSYLTEKQ